MGSGVQLLFNFTPVSVRQV